MSEICRVTVSNYYRPYSKDEIPTDVKHAVLKPFSPSNAALFYPYAYQFNIQGVPKLRSQTFFTLFPYN